MKVICVEHSIQKMCDDLFKSDVLSAEDQAMWRDVMGHTPVTVQVYMMYLLKDDPELLLFATEDLRTKLKSGHLSDNELQRRELSACSAYIEKKHE